MARWSVVLVIGLLCVLISAAVKANAFPETGSTLGADSAIDSSLYEDVSIEGLRAQQSALCAPFALPLADCACVAVAVTLCIIGVSLLGPKDSQAIPVASLLLLSITCIHLIKKVRGRTLRNKYDYVSELIGAKTWKSLVD